MNILVVNSAYKTKLMLISDKSEKVLEAQIDEKTNDKLLEHIENLLKQRKLALKDVDAIAVCVGPGSFTGLRASISLIKGISMASSVKVLPFTSFEEIEYNKGDYLVLEGFSNFVYTLYKGEAKCQEIDLVKCEIQKISGKVLCKTEALKEKFSGAQLATLKTQELIKQKYIAKSFCDIGEIEPLYLRASQAEIEREKKQNGKN